MFGRLDHILDLEAVVKDIIARSPKDSLRRAFLNEFGTDFLEKAKQANRQVRKLSKEYWAYRVDSYALFWKEQNTNGPLTHITENYASATSSIKGLADNLNSFIMTLYMTDEELEKLNERFENKPEYARIIDGKKRNSIKDRLPKVKGTNLSELMNQNWKKHELFFKFHRNAPQHAKTKQALILKNGRIYSPILSTPQYLIKDGKEVSISKLMNGTLDKYFSFSKLILNEVAEKAEALQPRTKESIRKNKYKMNLRAVEEVLKRTYIIGITAFAIGVVTNSYIQQQNENSLFRKVINIESKNNQVKLEPFIKEFNQDVLYEEHKIFAANKSFNQEKINLEKLQDNERVYTEMFMSKMDEETRKNYILALNEIIGRQDTILKQTHRIIKQNYNKNVSFWGNIDNRINESIPQLKDKVNDIYFEISELYLNKLTLERSILETIPKEEDQIVKDILIARAMTNLVQTDQQPTKHLYETWVEELKKDIYDQDLKTMFLLGLDFESGIDMLCEKYDKATEGAMLGYFLRNMTPYYRHLAMNVSDESIQKHRGQLLQEVKISDQVFSFRTLHILGLDHGDIFSYLIPRSAEEYPLHKIKVYDENNLEVKK